MFKTADLNNRNFYCKYYIVTAIRIQLFTRHFVMLGCV